MLETFLKTNFVGKDGYFWWIGQIAEEKYWKQNIAPRPTAEDSGKDFGGFGRNLGCGLLCRGTSTCTATQGRV